MQAARTWKHNRNNHLQTEEGIIECLYSAVELA
jgi:hypothetical protein